MRRSRMWIVVLWGALAFFPSLPVWAQCPAKTTVSDTLFNADGTLAAGRVVISWPTFQAGGCQVVAGQTSVAVNNGAFSVELYSNDTAVPLGTSYRVAYYLKSGRITTEYWVVPSSATPVNLAAVRSSSVPVPTVMFSQSQVTNLLSDLARKVELPSPCPAGKFLQASGSASPPQVNCVDGTGAPLASSTQSGTVKTDVTETDPVVYTKATADSLLAGKAGAAHTHAAADTTSGVFDPARLPNPSPSSLGGIKSGSCSGTDKVTGVSSAGAITCGADQSGGGSSSQHQVNGANLAANDPVNFQDSATIAFTNPSGGNVQAALKDGSVSAAKLSVANPTGAQLGGLGDANIPADALSPDRISGTAEVLASKNAANGYAGRDAGSRIAKAQAPSTTVYADASNTWSAGTQDMSGAGATLPVKAGTALQGSCTANKELFIDTDATAGQQLYICNGAGNGWNLVGDGSGGGDTTKTHYLNMSCDTPRTQSLAGNTFWTVSALTEWDFGHWEFVKDVDGKLYCHATIPASLATTPNGAVELIISANATSGVTRLSVRSFVAGDGDTLNPASGSWTSATAQDITVPGTARTAKLVSFTTLPTLTMGKLLVVEIYHEGAHANDTLAVNTELFKVRLKVDRTL